jgi:hypothetical protein
MRWGSSPVSVAALLVTCTFLLRLPAALLPVELNVDESQAVSQAMKFLLDPRPWISVDGQTWGPLNSYLITAFLLLGFKPGFVLAHLLADILVCLEVLLAYLTLRRIVSEKAALFGGSLMAFVYGFTTRLDYLHYAGELLPTVLLATGFYVLVLYFYCPTEAPVGRRASLVFLSTLALGAAPWCKLQAAPISAALGVMLLLAICRFEPSSGAAKYKVIAAFLAGSGLTTFVILAVIVRSGAVKDFWYSYILGNLQYSTHNGFIKSIAANMIIVRISPVSLILAIAACLLTYIAFNRSVNIPVGRSRWIAGAILVYVCAAEFSVCRVRYLFPHHTLFLIPPFIYAVAMLADYGKIFEWSAGRYLSSRWKSGVSFGLVSITIVLLSTYVLGYFSMLLRLGDARHLQQGSGVATADAEPGTVSGGAAGEILDWVGVAARSIAPGQWALSDSNQRIAAELSDMNLTRPVRTLAVWGWSPGVHVVSGAPSATRDANALFQLQKGSLQQYYRTRYVNDLRVSEPDVFIDAVSRSTFMWNDWTEADGYESMPELRSFVDANYVMVRQVALQPGSKPVRIFARRDLYSGAR